MIRLSLLGPTTCRGPSGTDFPGVVRSRKRLALLAYLAASDPKGFHRRDALLGLLWPESDQKRARGALRQAVRHLRSELGGVVISRGSEELGLDWDGFWCDAVAFRESLDQGHLLEGLELYKRDLLEGFYLTGAREFEQWLDGTRRALKRRGAEAAWSLADQAEHPIEAAGWGRRAIRFSPHSETAIRRLMRLLNDRGDATGALLEFDRFRKRVEEELGTGPGPETRAVANEIRAAAESPAPAVALRPASVGVAPFPSGAEANLKIPAEVVLQDVAPAVPNSSRIGLRSTPVRRATALGLIAAGAIGAMGVLDRPANELEFGTAERLSPEPGLEVQPALSPSGDRVAYMVGSFNEADLYVRRTSGGRPVPLTAGVPGGHHRPQWSPDGESVAFVTVEQDGAYKIHLAPATGGPPRVLVSSPPGTPLSGLAWSPSGRELSFTHLATIKALDLESGRARTVVDAWAPHSHAWSPDGQWIAFVAENSNYTFDANVAPSDVWLVPAAGGEPIQITAGQRTNQSPVWTPDSRSLLFVSNRDGPSDVYSIEIDDVGRPVGQPARLTVGLGALSISLSRDGRLLSYSVSVIDSDLWSLPMPVDGAVQDLEDATRITFERQIIETLRVSPDGEWIAYDSNRDGNHEIYKVRAAGGPATRLTHHPSDDFAPAWSPDGSEIAFYSFRNGNRDVFVMDVEGSRTVPVSSDPGSDAFPDWLPDGSGVAYHNNPVPPAEQRPTVVQSIRGGEPDEWLPPRPMTDEHGGGPVFSPDGKWMAYGGTKGARLRDLATGTTTTLLEGVHRQGPLVWTQDSESVLFSSTIDGVSGIWRIPRAGGEPDLVAVDPSGSWKGLWFDTDGERIYFARRGSAEADIWIAELGPR